MIVRSENIEPTSSLLVFFNSIVKSLFCRENLEVVVLKKKLFTVPDNKLLNKLLECQFHFYLQEPV